MEILTNFYNTQQVNNEVKKNVNKFFVSTQFEMEMVELLLLLFFCNCESRSLSWGCWAVAV